MIGLSEKQMMTPVHQSCHQVFWDQMGNTEYTPVMPTSCISVAVVNFYMVKVLVYLHCSLVVLCQTEMW